MNKPIYVFGHKNPDTDSICAAISYANLKKNLGQDKYIPARLGEINNETRYALKYFKVESPKKINDLKPQVSDLSLLPSVVAYENDSVRKALESIVTQTGRSIPVVDKHERFIGIVSISDLMPTYMGQSGKSQLKEFKTPFQNIMTELEAKIIKGTYVDIYIRGNVYLYSDIDQNTILDTYDIVICDSKKNNEYLYQSGVGCILLGNCDNILDLKIESTYRGVVLATKHFLFDIVKLINYSIPIASMVNKNNLEYFTTYESLDDVKENIITSKHKRFPVVDELGYIQGMISRSDFMDVNRRKAILVDHNEKNQSIEGIEEVEIIEVIDHHRVADIQTIAPLYFRIEPLGCTCTIIAKMYEENKQMITKDMAGIMLSAIISDTLLFKSPTCTQQDKDMGHKLAKILNINIEKYGMDLINAGSSLTEEDPDIIIKKDIKRFMFGQHKIMISQINTGDYYGFFSIYNSIIESMENICKREKIDLAVLMVTDIMLGGTELLAVGEARWIAENAFSFNKEDKSIFLPNVFSRKKQIVPRLMNAARL